MQVVRTRRPGGGVPPFVSLPEVIKDAAVNEFPGQGAGFLGKPFEPFLVEGDDQRTGFRPPEATSGFYGGYARDAVGNKFVVYVTV